MLWTKSVGFYDSSQATEFQALEVTCIVCENLTTGCACERAAMCSCVWLLSIDDEHFRLLPDLSLFSLPLKGTSSNFILFFVNLKTKGLHGLCGRCGVCLCIQGEQQIDVFLMCFRHVWRHKEGNRPGRVVSPSPFLCIDWNRLTRACLLGFWAN